jgi:hypothetical protein
VVALLALAFSIHEQVAGLRGKLRLTGLVVVQLLHPVFNTSLLLAAVMVEIPPMVVVVLVVAAVATVALSLEN